MKGKVESPPKVPQPDSGRAWGNPGFEGSGGHHVPRMQPPGVGQACRWARLGTWDGTGQSCPAITAPVGEATSLTPGLTAGSAQSGPARASVASAPRAGVLQAGMSHGVVTTGGCLSGKQTSRGTLLHFSLASGW